MAESGTEKKLASIYEKLQSKDKDIRKKAVKDLAESGDKKVLPALLGMAKDKIRDVRVEAVKSLFCFKEPFTEDELQLLQPVMLKTARDKAAAVRLETLYVLDCFGDSESLEVYLQLLCDEKVSDLETKYYSSSRDDFAEYEGIRIGTSKLVKRLKMTDLVPFLTNNDALVRAKAAEIMGNIDMKYLPEDFSLVDAYASVIDQEKDEQVISNFIVTLSWRDDHEVDKKIKLIAPYMERDNQKIKESAIFALCSLGCQEAYPYVVDLLKNEIETAQDVKEFWAMRRKKDNVESYAQALKDKEAIKNVAEAISIYLDHENSQVRELCLKTYFSLHDPIVFTYFKKVLQSNMPEMKKMIFSGLFPSSTVQDDGLIFLEDTLKTVKDASESHGVREEAVSYLGRAYMEVPGVKDTMLRLILDKNETPDVRSAGIRSLSLGDVIKDDPDIRDAICRLIFRENESLDVLCTVIESVENLTEDEERQLIKVFDNAELPMAEKMLLTLNKYGYDGILDLLKKFIKRFPFDKYNHFKGWQMEPFLGEVGDFEVTKEIAKVFSKPNPAFGERSAANKTIKSIKERIKKENAANK